MAYTETSVYGYITGDELELFSGIDYSTTNATRFSEANVMARVTAAERMVHGYLGVSSALTVTDGIKTSVTVIAAKLMQMALIEYGIAIEEDDLLDLVKMSTLTILRNFLTTDVGVDSIPMSGADS